MTLYLPRNIWGGACDAKSTISYLTTLTLGSSKTLETLLAHYSSLTRVRCNFSFTMQAIQKGVEAVTSAATGTTSSTSQQDREQQSGQEPVNAVKGQGTPDKPFDQGNQDGKGLYGETEGAEDVG